MASLKNNLFFKIGMIVVVVLLLLIPQAMISFLVTEREQTQAGAVSEVSSKWGESQTLSGPYLVVPFHNYVTQDVMQNNVMTTRTVRETKYIYILPDDLRIASNVAPERRYRNIYEVVVYNAKVAVAGKFESVDLKEFNIPEKDLLLGEAFLAFGISDLRGIKQQVALTWNETQYLFNPGVVSNDVLANGINTPVALSPEASGYTFAFDLDLNGSQSLFFVPVGKNTAVAMTSPWPTPSFNGAFLPDSNAVRNDGFDASWHVLHLNRNFPQSWIGAQQTSEAAFGLDLLLPVDNYQKTTRSIKYAILFIVCTFLVFFFVEVHNRVFIHPVQYLLVGLALVVFYTLLLSISEYIPFNGAFAISAVATLLLIGGYVRAILKSTALTGVVCGILLVLYVFIFAIIQLENYALLIGSIGLFIILAIVMIMSRKIDWYNLKLGE